MQVGEAAQAARSASGRGGCSGGTQCKWERRLLALARAGGRQRRAARVAAAELRELRGHRALQLRAAGIDVDVTKC